MGVEKYGPCVQAVCTDAFFDIHTYGPYIRVPKIENAPVDTNRKYGYTCVTAFKIMAYLMNMFKSSDQFVSGCCAVIFT